jgi:hypothetical protein
MWTNLNTPETLTFIKPGCLIAKDPDNPHKSYVIKSFGEQVITAFDQRRKKTILMYPGEVAISGNWWVEHSIT